MQVEEIAHYIDVFYNTNDENRRKHVFTVLNALQEQADWWKVAISLIQLNFSSIVQFYSAKSLYDIFNKKFDVLAENTNTTNAIRQFYVEQLTVGVQRLPHSLLNILTSGLAVFLMKCLPDIWSNPFFDLINLWSTQQELLMRVLAEVGAEFSRISLPLKQRNILRTELLRISQDIAQMTNAVLLESSSPASLKNAAVECVELWLKLPGAKISDFLIVFNSVFENISTDIVALTRILSTLKSNEELPHLPELILQFTQFIAVSAAPLILNQINVASTNKDVDFEEEMNEIIPLICAVTDFAHTFIHQIIGKIMEAIKSSNNEIMNVYTSLCTFFARISMLEGAYPIEECISDLPEMFWCTLCEELTFCDDSANVNCKAYLKSVSTTYFLEILRSAIAKISYLPTVINKCDKVQFERFQSYRLTRSDVSKNAIRISSSDTLNLLASLLDGFLQAQDIFSSEAAIYYFKETADFLKEEHMDSVISILLKCDCARNWPNVLPAQLCQYGMTLMDFLSSIEHLLITSTKSNDALMAITNMTLNFMRIEGVSQCAIDALTAFIRNRDAVLKVVLEPIIQECYQFFCDESKEYALRLSAIRCMGIALSMKENTFILNSLDQFLLPRLMSLKEIVGGNVLLSQFEKENKILFELGVLAQLVETLEVKNAQGNLLKEDEANEKAANEISPVCLIIEQCITFFDTVLSDSAILSSRDLVTKVCEVLRAGLLSLYTLAEPLIQTYLKYLDVFLFTFTAPACELTKTLFLTFRTANNQVAVVLFARLAEWFSKYCNETSVENGNAIFGEKDEKFLELANYILKKNWRSLEAVASNEDGGQYAVSALQSVCFSAIRIIQQSRDVTLMQESFRVLLLIVKNGSASDVALVQQLVQAVREPVITAAFLGTQSELCATHLTIIAEILYLFAKNFPDVTRKVALALPGGDSQLVAAMFSQPVSARSFRSRVTQINQAVMKQPANCALVSI